MIPYIGCEAAREMLDAFVDGELAVDDQVAVESHLRWCRTCGARVEDLRLIGASMRLGSASPAPDDARALTAIHAGALSRVRAEHDQSFAVRVRALFEDMRLFWPAVGASAALAACCFVALSVMQLATAENPASLAAMIDRLDRPSAPELLPANPGSDQNPMRLDGRVSFPRGLDGMPALESTSDEEVAVAVAAVVTREGRIATYDLLESEHMPPNAKRRDAGDVSAVLDAVKRSRFAPAEAAGGTKVAVNMVWLLVRTTAKGTARAYARPAPPVPDIVKPIEIEETPVVPSTGAPAPNPSTA
jgi:putative zinc finger protein